ncbi:MAG: DUF2156 domain-containing protein [Firmicutes bacterium]|nr:DUF2156 domain-containing protein [Bacillota bacterium]
MSIFARNFDNISGEERALLDEYFNGYDYRGANFTFLSNYVWRTMYCLSWEIIEGYLCISAGRCDAGERDAVMAIPLTKNGEYESNSLKKCIDICKTKFDRAGVPFAIGSVPGHMVEIIERATPGEFEFEHIRDLDEYVYVKEKLITLSGRALHKKKNHLNFFLRTYEYESKPLTKEMQSDILELTARIKDYKEMDPDEVDDLEGEYDAIVEMLDHLDDPDVYSVAIFIKGHLEAYAIGERLSEKMAVEHFEKANGAYRGLYQLVCREFCLTLPEEITLVNREEDMGLPNLRQAKEALKPEFMEEKYMARPKV